MYQRRTHGDSPVSIISAGVRGAWPALLLAQAGRAVTVHERSDASMTLSTSHWAGGMLAPWCEAEASEPVISRLGIRSLDLLRQHVPQTPFRSEDAFHKPLGRRDARALVRGGGLRARDQQARHPLARPLAAACSADAL